MEITIVNGSLDYINDCEDALVNTALGFEHYDDTVIPKIYNTVSSPKRASKPKEIVDEEALIIQFII